MLKILASAVFALVFASSSSSAAPNVTLNLGANWFSAGVNGPGVAQTSNGTIVTYTADWAQAGVWLAKEKAAIENHIVEIDFEASAKFKSSGSNLHIYTIFAASPWNEYKNCPWFISADIKPGTRQTIRCTISTRGTFNQTTYPIEVRLVARGAPNGTVLITGGRVLAP